MTTKEFINGKVRITLSILHHFCLALKSYNKDNPLDLLMSKNNMIRKKYFLNKLIN